jgi:glutaredoxin 3
MPPVRIYTTPFCPYCARAKSLLARKGVGFEEIDVYMNPEARAEMTARCGGRTVPQIFIGERYIGGCDELHALDEAGELDPLLRACLGIPHGRDAADF